jgi:hypothetical protein
MDIEKEREAFEREFKTRWELGHFILKMVEFVDESQDYAPVNAVKQLSDEYYWILALNTGWCTWQAAKAQAIPEGFVLVSQKELLELGIAINAVDLATHTDGKPNEVREMWQQVALKLGALCSTGASQ